MENDPSLKILLEENLRINKENNKMLHKMRRAVWWGVLWKIIVWAIILGFPLYLYYAYLPVVQTFIKPFMSTTTAQGSVEPSMLEQLQELAKKYKGVGN